MDATVAVVGRRCSTPLFLEAETLVEESEVSAALDDIRAVLAELGIGPQDLTREAYTAAVATQRGGTDAADLRRAT
jgi:hypothetical protein